VLTARLSKRVVDDQQTAAVLGHSLVGKIGRQNALAGPLPELLRANDYPALNIIDELCVRAEANARRPGFVTVVVVGTEQSAGATTVATAMAGQFARFGTHVLLIDADPRRAGITEGFKAFGDGGIPALLATAPDGSLTAGRRSSDSFRRARNLVTPTPIPEVAVLGRGDKAGSPSLRRSDAETLMERALMLAPVVVIDGGAVLDSAATVELCRLADAVVLAVPTQRQQVSQLEVVSRQLGRRQGELLPVSTRARRHRDGLGLPSSVESEAVITSIDTDTNTNTEDITTSIGDASSGAASRPRPARPGATTVN
jgi:Mrp family chromosome partitioning ATPase